MGEDSKGQRKLEDSDWGLLPAVEGHSLEQNRIECKLKTAPSQARPCGQEDQTQSLFFKMPALQSYKKRRVAGQHFHDGQTPRLQPGAGEDGYIVTLTASIV